MKRIVPLWITAIVGVVLIVSNFLPGARSWGEEATTWFGIIAAVAFVLGGGSLLIILSGTDLVTGFGSSIAKKIGTALMRREVKHLVDTFLEATDSAVSAR